PGAIRLADLLGAFSLASDLAMGLHTEHGARSCYIGMHIAQELGLSLEQRTDLYYAELLKDAGCTTWTSQLASFWLVDELAAKQDLQFFRNARNPLDVVSWLMKYVATGAPFPTRAAHILDFLVKGREFMREGFESACHVAARIAQRLGMPRAVQDALMQVFEQWDGHGMPYGIKSNSIPTVSRIVLVTSFLEVFHRVEGREAAKHMALARRGKAFDPSVVDAFLSVIQGESFWKGLEHERVWDTVRSMEPEESPYRYIGEEKLTDVALAFGDYADLKSPFLAGHSRRVADLAERIARKMGLTGPHIAIIYQAALVHNIGIVAVPSFVLNKPRDRLTEAEWEQLRLHPYYSERILSKVPALEALIPMVGAHHERMDGQGYHRGLPGAQIPPGARIIAVADRFDELSHGTPDHPALDPDDIVMVMRQDVGPGLWPEAFQALVEDLTGVSDTTIKRTLRRQWPAGLTDREVEVLRLMAKGMGKRQAAKTLFVSEGTIRSHLEHIYAKIGVSNRAAATLFTIEHDLLH
ncbi:MAG: C-di-GMP phosphodiesterase class, partial [Dehalococcoidia bacterium]|nr:C-di-GMP phosphodiesterase class [Dehalococcoidia bacterium]